MEKTLDEKRYEHTLGVAYTAAVMAMYYGVDPIKAQMAGLLHDCAKCMEYDKAITLCEKHNIQITETERKNPLLLHAKVGSYIAMHKYNITDPDIVNSILNHTTGRPDMSLLEKIIYIADYIEPGRRKAPNLDTVRKLAFGNLDEALLMILSDTLQYLKDIHSDIDAMTIKTYEFYSTRREKVNE